MHRQKNEIKEIFDLFIKLGVPSNILNHWCNEIDIDRTQTEARIVDLALCVLIYHGLKPEHIHRMAIRLLPRRCRPKHLIDRINYLSEYVVNVEPDDEPL